MLNLAEGAASELCYNREYIDSQTNNQNQGES